MTSKLFLLLALAVASAVADPRLELGTLQGAGFRIDVPETWNGSLVLLCHGYAMTMPDFSKETVARGGEVYTRLGYAVAQSAYASEGWAVQDALKDTEALRSYFNDKYAKPKETFLVGLSMGGHIVALLSETNPNLYAGTLALCPAVAPTYDIVGAGFHSLVAFDSYFPGVLPDPSRIPSGFRLTPDDKQKIAGLLAASPDKAAAYRSVIRVHSDKEVVDNLPLTLHAVQNVQKRAGGNPFDNRNFIYVGSPNDNALNDSVKRYTADSTAWEFLRKMPAPSGRVRHPLLAVHTTYDPIVSPLVSNQYAELVAAEGGSSLIRLEYVKRDGHCYFTPPEISGAFQRLVEWVHSGKKP